MKCRRHLFISNDGKVFQAGNVSYIKGASELGGNVVSGMTARQRKPCRSLRKQSRDTLWHAICVADGISVFCDIIIVNAGLISRVFINTADGIAYGIMLHHVISIDDITLLQDFLLHLDI